jgi:hypothetical protein
MRRENYYNILLLSVSVLICILILELIIPIIISDSEFCKEYAKSDLRELGENFEVSEIPNLYFIPKPNSSRFNYLGLNDRDYNTTKRNDTFRIMVLGDSITELEYFVDHDRNNLYHEILEKKLNQMSDKVNYEVWNLGVRKYNTIQEYLYFKHKFLKYNPDLVIIAYFEYNDYDSPRLKYNKNYSLTKNCVLSTIPKIFPISKKEHEFLLNSNIYQAINVIGYKILSFFDSINYPPLLYFKSEDSMIFVQKNREALMQLKKLSEEYNFKLVLVIFTYLKNDYERDPWLMNISKEFNSLDLREILLKNEPNLTKLTPDGEDIKHLNVKAHKIVADAIYEYLISNDLLW